MYIKRAGGEEVKRGVVTVMEHLERRVLLAAAAVADAPEVLTDGQGEEAAAVEATVATRVVFTLTRDSRGSPTGVLRAVVTAHAKTDPAGAPIVGAGRVMFYRNGKLLTPKGVRVRDGTAEFSAFPEPGIYTFEARYEGKGAFLPSSSGTIEVDARWVPHVLLASGIVYGKEGQPLALKAGTGSFTRGGLPQGRVTFRDEAGRVIGSTKIVGTRAVLYATLPLGKHQITASYSGDRRYRPAESEPQTVRVYHRTSVDLAVAYTPAAMESMGGPEHVRHEIVRAVDAVNTVLRNSRVRVSVRLVAAVLVDYEETGNYERDLKRLANEEDGHMDLVPSLQQAYGADLVSLLVGRKGKGGVVGTAYRMTRTRDDENERSAFSVVHALSAAGPDYTLAHELAHNFGAAHDEESMPPGRLAAPYAHGFRGFVKGEQVRDVMGYPPGRTLPYFSNPRIKYGGIRIGDERRADVARLIGETAPLVAAYQDEKVRWGESLICTCW